MAAKLVRTGIVLLMLIGVTCVFYTPVLASSTNISAIPSITTVSPGGTFDLGITVNSDVASFGMQFILKWDPAKVQCNSVAVGDYYSAYAQSHGGSVYLSPDNRNADNTTGRFPIITNNTPPYNNPAISVSLSGTTGGVTGTGNVYVLHMAAKSGVSGSVDFTLSSTQIGNKEGDPLPAVINNGHITISSGSSNALAVTSSAATNITTTGATLNGSLSSLGSDISASVSFEYGTTTGYGAATTAQTLNTAGPFSAAVTGLSANTSYHFRVKAVDSNTVYGDDATFTTSQISDTMTSTTTTRTSTTLRTNPITTKPSSKPNTLLKSPLATTLDLSDSMDTGGMLQTDFTQGNIRYSGNNQIVSLIIKSGTRVVAVDGSPVAEITVQSGSNVPSAPSGQNIVSAVDFGPTGATFSSPIAVVYGYDPTMVSQNVQASGLALKYFDSQTNKWVKADYTVDIQNHQITANLSHFSLYAVMASNSTGFMGVGWSLAGIIIVLEMVMGGLVIFYFLRRKRPLVPAMARAKQIDNNTILADQDGVKAFDPIQPKYESRESRRINWDDILPETIKNGEPFTTHLEIKGGKIIIPRDGKSADIEITNSPDARILVTLEYNPETHPRGLAKIMVLGPASEYEKSKEIGK